MAKDPSFNTNVLAIGAHPDDVEFCCAGVLIRANRLGYSTGIVDLTKGEASSRGTVDSRARETQAASAAMGLTFRENLGLADCALSEHSSEQLRSVVRVIRRHKPEIIIVPYWEERHPDHVAASHLVTKAVFLSGVAKFDPSVSESTHTVQQVLYYLFRYTARPSFILDITDCFEQKMLAIRCYASQLGIDSPATEPETLASSPLTIPSFEARDRYYGAMIGAGYGEPFITRNILGVSDPVMPFRKYSSSNALIYPG